MRGQLRLDPRPAGSSVGWLLIAYALVIYPLLGWSQGHGYPAGPSFGAPCPTTIFFLGMMLWAVERIPVSLVVVPLLWAVLGTSAALQLGIWEDLGLPISAIVVLVAAVRRQRGGAMPRFDRASAALYVGPLHSEPGPRTEATRT